ncbi:hypothetical protein NDU88_002223 [Pleurodeles waltl]|uniref:Uncharacterized protein n=1 Tax=Pleurodeles waltl TaxID=8319 RepID=A0AAV7NLE1_PLEWA|nr:hypothetical protein NDU88_002223 [Pleurodeles waltl]
MRTAGPEAYTIMAAEVCCRESAQKRQAEAARPDLGGGRGGTLTGVCSCIDSSERIRRGGQRPGAICPGRPIEGCRPWLSRPRGGSHLAVWEWPEGSVVLLAPDRGCWQPDPLLERYQNAKIACMEEACMEETHVSFKDRYLLKKMEFELWVCTSQRAERFFVKRGLVFISKDN